jgi:predicted MFS family arabinose efflux permease
MVLSPALTMLPTGMPVALGVTLFRSILGWSINVPQQWRLVALAPDHQSTVLSLNASALYLGVSIGSTPGSATLSHGNFEALGPVASLVATTALTSLLAL